MKEQQVYTLQKIAELLKARVETVRRVIRTWELKATAPGLGRAKGADLRVSSTELTRWWKAKGSGELFDAVTDTEVEDQAC